MVELIEIMAWGGMIGAAITVICNAIFEMLEVNRD